jgi:ABC-type lipoprotein release transport system permease subunit
MTIETVIPELFAVPSIIMAVAILIGVVALIIGFEKSRSKKYREMMSDMYIVGTVKNLAKEDGIDLVAELRDFSRFVKKTDLKEKEIDRVIEMELNEKIAFKNEKLFDKK